MKRGGDRAGRVDTAAELRCRPTVNRTARFDINGAYGVSIATFGRSRRLKRDRSLPPPLGDRRARARISYINDRQGNAGADDAWAAEFDLGFCDQVCIGLRPHHYVKEDREWAKDDEFVRRAASRAYQRRPTISRSDQKSIRAAAQRVRKAVNWAHDRRSPPTPLLHRQKSRSHKTAR
jgi:hypothetical protein